MDQTAEEFISNHDAVITSEFHAQQYAEAVARLEAEIPAIEATIKTERVAACVRGRGRGRPTHTAADLRLVAAKQELEQMKEALATEQEALPAIKAHVQSLFPTQQRIGELAAAIAEKASAFRHLLETALLVQGEALDRIDELDRIPRQHGLLIPRPATVGPRTGQRVGNPAVHVPCLREQVQSFLGLPDDSTPKSTVHPVVPCTAETSGLDDWAKAEKIAEGVKDVPEVIQAAQQFNEAMKALNTPPFDDNGQPDPNRPSIHAAASAAEAAYWQAVATAARVEPSAMAWKSEVPGLWDNVRVFLPGKAPEIVLMA